MRNAPRMQKPRRDARDTFFRNFAAFIVTQRLLAAAFSASIREKISRIRHVRRSSEQCKSSFVHPEPHENPTS